MEDIMKCANPVCHNHLLYLRGGTLRLLEIERTPGSGDEGEGGGIPERRRAARYFWLCPECSQSLVLRRWTQDGVVLEPRNPSHGAPIPTWTVAPKPAVDAESILHFRPRAIRSA
jgi:hypothetical protein